MRARNSATETLAVPRLPTTTAAAALAARMADSKSASKRQHGRQHGHHGVAGAGDVAHLHRIGRHVHGAFGRDQRHAVLAAGDQHGFGVELLAQAIGGGRDLLVAAGGAVGGVGQFLPVGRDQRGAAVDRIVAALRIDHHRLAGRVGGGDDVAHHARS